MAGRKSPANAVPGEQIKPRGRPSSYCPEIADQLCTAISEGESLRSVCASANMPDRTTIFRWLRENEDFRSQYAHAREAAADWYAEEIVEIADEARDKENAPAIKVRVDARMWVASKLRPKVYGNTAAIQHSGPDGGPIKTASTVTNVDLSKMSDDELAKLYAEKVDPS